MSQVDMAKDQTTAGAPQPDGAVRTLHGLVEEQVARTPDAVAVEFEGAEVSYRELDRMARRVAAELRRRGAGPESLVAVFADRSIELVAGLLGVLKAGAAYLPVDPGYPSDRVAFMLADAAAEVVLTQRHLVGDLPGGGAAALLLEEAAFSVDVGTPEDASVTLYPENAAYVIYTSGSTGRPKGVPNTHAGIVNRLEWMQEVCRLTAADSVLQKTPASFDVSVWEFFLPLMTGARLVLAAPGGHRDPSYLVRLIVERGVTTAHFVPSMLSVFLTKDVAAAVSLRRVICSGEELPVAAAVELLRRLPSCELYNLYGPTEAAVDVSSWQCTEPRLTGRSAVPIGTAISGMRLEVLGPDGVRADDGEIGELHIGGVGVARGYLGRPGLTAERFVPDPWGDPGARLYRTGDLARRNPDGDLEYHGRTDRQVKIRGQRIELGEIEAALRRLPETRESAVVVSEPTPGDQRLVAYLTSRAGRPIDPAKARRHLRTVLPDYMIPASFVTVRRFPLTPNGKLDREALGRTAVHG